RRRGLLRPWTYLHPITLRFVAADLGRIAVSSADPALRVIPVFVVERWSPTRGLTVAVDIPKGTTDGDIITLRGFGIEGFGGGPPGDLNVIVSVIPDPAIEERG
ncbi:MAG: hypothetical protein EBU57_13030, partial [Alphaproteobacteria bacterium]|nr:hypothetical protein [Alphaproteobacteria bacterium]